VPASARLIRICYTNLLTPDAFLLALQVTQHLSSHEQNILLPWIKTFPKKLVDRAPVWAWPIGTMAAVYGIASYVDSLDYAEDLEHRF
jgi:hypothetical protein